MKQILQSLKDGSTLIEDVPCPRLLPGCNLIETSTTLVSSGTERMLLEFGRGNLLQKARKQPEKVKMVVDKAKTDGILSTIDAVKAKLDQPLALGYCNVGRIVETNSDGFRVGQRVVSNGKHAEIVNVPKNLCAKIPANVNDETAAFTVVAAIGLQGIRLANPTLGETVVVIGLGLIGLLTVQMLIAQGCRVMGVDFDPKRLELAKSFGAEAIDIGAEVNLIEKAVAYSRGHGADAVLITAATSDNSIVSQAAKMSRQRGRIILVGTAGLELNRSDFYEKEISFQVSCSYGPGRYDQNYEENGNDYPIGLVRWTEQRNFEAVLDLMSNGAICVEQLISHRFDIANGDAAISALLNDEPQLGIIIDFKRETVNLTQHKIQLNSDEVTELSKSKGSISFLGAGNYAGRILIPAFKHNNANLNTIVSQGGLSATYYGKKFGFKYASSDESEVLSDKSVDAVVIATRHNLHGKQVVSALNAGKHIFCEKPLCINSDELVSIREASLSNPNQIIMVGFNRRFSPLVTKMKSLLDDCLGPKNIIITINAGYLSREHWTQDFDIGGGRLIGECCHFIDLARHIANCQIKSYSVRNTGNLSDYDPSHDSVVITLEFVDGSIAVINYFSNGNNSYPKERVEVFSCGRILQIDNFRILRGWGWKKFKKFKLWRQDKGQLKCVAEFIKAVKGQAPSPISREELFEVSEVTIKLANLTV